MHLLIDIYKNLSSLELVLLFTVVIAKTDLKIKIRQY